MDAAAPLQLVTERAVVTVLPRLHEREPRLRPAHPHAVGHGQAGDDAPVDDAGRSLVGLRQEQFVGPGRGIDHGAVGERVRIERREDEGVEVLAHDRAAGGEVVGRRADGRAHDQAVGPVGGGDFAIDEQADLDHRKRRAGEDRRLVESEDAVDDAVVADHLGLEHQVVDEPEGADGDVVERLPGLRNGEVGEEAERAEVDAEHRSLPVAHPAGRPQDRAVATEHDDEVGAFSATRSPVAHAPFAPAHEAAGDRVAGPLQQRSQAIGLDLHPRQVARPHDRYPQLGGCRLPGTES